MNDNGIKEASGFRMSSIVAAAPAVDKEIDPKTVFIRIATEFAAVLFQLVYFSRLGPNDYYYVAKDTEGKQSVEPSLAANLVLFMTLVIFQFPFMNGYILFMYDTCVIGRMCHVEHIWRVFFCFVLVGVQVCAAWVATSATAASSGNGLSNNRPFAGVSDNQTATSSGVQNAGIGNTALQYKIGRYYDTSSNQTGIVGTSGLVTVAQLATEFRPYFEQKTNYLVWYDFAVIKLAHLFESLGKMGLVRRFDATLRLWVNTGIVKVDVNNPGIDASQNYTLTPENNSFSNTCPLMVNWVPGGGSYGVPSGTTSIVAGLYINKPPSTSYTGINLSSSNASHPLPNCRLYYSQIVLDPQKSITYTNMNLNKKVVYRTFVSNQYNNIAKGSSFNQLINSGIVHPTGVLIVPFIGAQSSGTDRGFGDSQWKSPFDTCPSTTSPCSLTNLQVSVGGSNVLQSTLYYTYERFDKSRILGMESLVLR
jgi:hypothetical protein